MDTCRLFFLSLTWSAIGDRGYWVEQECLTSGVECKGVITGRKSFFVIKVTLNKEIPLDPNLKVVICIKTNTAWEFFPPFFN